MNSEKFSVQSTLEANYLNVRLEEPVELDEIAMKVLKEDCPDFLIPYRLTTVNDNITLKYKLINTIALEYANLTLSKKDFVQLYMNMLIPFVKGRDWFLDYHNICIDPRYVYLEKHTGKVYFIYIPERFSQNTNEEILEFFKKVFTNSTITDDKDFQVRLFRYFTNGSITLMGLYQIFQEEMGKKPAAGSSIVMEEKKTDMQPKPKPPVIINDPVEKETQEPQAETKGGGSGNSFLDGFLGGKKGKDQNKDKKGKESKSGLFGDDDDFLSSLDIESDFDFLGDSSGKKKKEKPKQEKETQEKKWPIFGKKKENEHVAVKVEKKEETTKKPAFGKNDNNAWMNDMFMNDDQSEETEISTGENNYGSACLELIDSPIPGAIRRINLEFAGSYVTIGRTSNDQIKPDIAFPSDFKRIGRQHARIERRGSDFFVIDLGSANHTFLNGRVLAPNQPYHLEDGMELTFTDSKPVSYRVRL